VRFLLTVLLLAASLLLGRILWELTGPPTPFFLACLAVYLAFWAFLLFSCLGYRRYRDGLQKAWLVLLFSAVPLVLVDLALNQLRDHFKYPKIRSHPVVHHKLVPDTTSEMRAADFRALLHTNRFGMRGGPVSEVKPAGVTRILLLGDSFTMGEGVQDEEAFAAILQRELSRRWPGRYEVLNGGQDSYSPLLSYLDLKHNLMKLSPDLVLLNFDMSDLLQEQYYRSLAVRGRDGDFLRVPNPHDSHRVAVWIEDFVSARLYVLRYVFLRVRDALNGEPETMEAVISRRTGGLLRHTLAADREDRTAQWQAIDDSLLRIRNLCRERGATFAMSLYPWGHQVSDREWIPGRNAWIPEGAVPSEASFDHIRGFCRENNVPLVDTVAAFRAYRGPELLYFHWDMHWTPAGHQVMAAQLLPFFAENKEFPLRHK
jgi:hypothetical protein